MIVPQVEVYGPGVESLLSTKPTNFTVDVRKAGQAPLEVIVQDGDGRDVGVRLEDKHDGTVQCHYNPISNSDHVVMVRRKKFGIVWNSCATNFIMFDSRLRIESRRFVSVYVQNMLEICL